MMVTEKTTISAELFARAETVLPGGVSSPVRAFRAVGGTPRFIHSGAGCRMTDEDGNEYLDFCSSWGPLILGHAHPEIVRTVQEAISRGMTFGTATRTEVELAEKVCDWVGPVDKVRFVSSGTEAVMSAIRLARAFTGRDKIIKFDGCYHGHADHLLVKAGSGLATFGTPSSAGVPDDFSRHTIVLPLDDESAVEQALENNKDQLAAIIIEPIPANNGLLLQRPEYLQFLRRITSRYQTLLIFDEVISGFRVGRGGAAEMYGIEPDLMTFGKVIGGGMPVGAFGGRGEIMDIVSPLGPAYQAGTLSGNPVAMAAGLATLDILEKSDAYAVLESRGKFLVDSLRGHFDFAKHKVEIQRIGSIFWLSLDEGSVPRRADAITAKGIDRYTALFNKLINRGVYIAPSGYEVGFISLAHSEDDLNSAAKIMGQALTEVFASYNRPRCRSIPAVHRRCIEARIQFAFRPLGSPVAINNGRTAIHTGAACRARTAWTNFWPPGETPNSVRCIISQPNDLDSRPETVLLAPDAKGGKMISKKHLLLQIYLYLICLVAVVTSIVLLGNGLWGLVRVAAPQLTISENEYKSVASFEYYRRSGLPQKTIRAPKIPSDSLGVDLAENEAALRKYWEEERQLILDGERRGGLREFVRMWVWLIVVAPIYLFHWRAVRRLRDEESSAPKE